MFIAPPNESAMLPSKIVVPLKMTTDSSKRKTPPEEALFEVKLELPLKTIISPTEKIHPPPPAVFESNVFDFSQYIFVSNPAVIHPPI